MLTRCAAEPEEFLAWNGSSLIGLADDRLARLIQIADSGDAFVPCLSPANHVCGVAGASNLPLDISLRQATFDEPGANGGFVEALCGPKLPFE